MDDAVELRREREQTLLGLARRHQTRSSREGGLAALAVNPTVRLTVPPGDPSSRCQLRIPGQWSRR